MKQVINTCQNQPTNKLVDYISKHILPYLADELPIFWKDKFSLHNKEDVES